MANLSTATPPMGWNSWNTFGPRVTAERIVQTAEEITASGLHKLGYEYVVIDDCWSEREGRDSSGNLVPDHERFPNGIKPVADHLHALGLKIGIYSDAAELTCGGYPGSYGYEEQDAALWASWGIDFLKYDYCNVPEDQATAIARYRRMGDALEATGREFVFSLCEWGGRAPHLWGKSVGGTMWRVSADLFDSWVDIWVEDPGYLGVGVDSSIDIAASLAGYSEPGSWNDLDMLVVGLKGSGQIHGDGMTHMEYQTHLSIWVMAASPLMIGCDIRSMSDETRTLLTNEEVIVIDQDPLGVAARRIRSDGGAEVWRRPLADGSTAVALLNRGSSPVEIEITSADVGVLDGPKPVRDLWQRSDEESFTERLSRRVLPHQTILLKVGAPQ
jgi:alpha-galactosidase